MEVAIIGAGVGGLTLALSLLKVGIKNINLYEASAQVSELGVGINILPHAIRELDELGLLEKLLSVSVETTELQYYTRKGQLIWQEGRGKKVGYRWPQISIHRAHLIKILHDAVVERLGAESIHTDHKLQDFTKNIDGTVTANFNQASVTVDCLVGCDGLHSMVRKKLYPSEGAAKWNGVTMWRGTSIMKPIIAGNAMVIAGNSQHRMVIYPISKPLNAKGEVLINWVAEHKTTNAQSMPKQDWNYQVDQDEIPEYFNHFDFLNVQSLMTNATEIYKYPMVDRDPLPSWDFGNVTLLGDAAHPMYPWGSNGASQAVLDAKALAQHLFVQPSIAQAVSAYDTERRLTTESIVLSNRQAGPEQCLDIVEDRAPEGFEQLDDVISQQELEQIASAYKKIAGFDVDILNNKKYFVLS